jgi:hypothetical protein
MSKQLDRLIKRHQNGIARNHYSRDFKEDASSVEDKHEYRRKRSWHHYSTLLEEAQAFEKAEDEFLDLGDNPQDILSDNSEQTLESSGEKAALMLRSSKYKLLSKLFSDINGITCSRKLSGKLISYYLRNRRKHRGISKSYSRELSYRRNHGNVSLDDMLHEMYMELGKTLYFSFIEKLSYNARFLVFKLMKSAISYMVTLGGAGFLGLTYHEIFMKISAFFAKFLAKLLSIVVEVDPNTPAFKLFAAMLLGVLSAAGIFFSVFALFMNIVGDDKEAFEVYEKGRAIYKEMKKALRAGLPTQLGTKGIIAAAIQINSQALDTEFMKKTLEAIKNIKEDVSQFIKFQKDPDFEEIIEKTPEFSCSVKVLVSQFFNNLVSSQSGQKIHMPDAIVLKPFIVSNNDSGEDALVAPSQSADSKTLPRALMPIALITSPQIRIDIKAQKSNLTIQFSASKYFGKYSNLKQEQIADFVKSYLKLYNEDEERERLEKVQEYLG